MSETSTVPRHSVDLALGLARLQALVLGIVLGMEVGGIWGVALGITIALAPNLLFLWVEHKGKRATTLQDDSRNSAIDALYAELRPLMSRPEPWMDEEIERKLARLRSLQQEEAVAMRQRFEARLHLKPGEGWQALNEARKLLSEDENRPPSNQPISRQA